MNASLILGLIHNIALLISMGFLGSIYWKKDVEQLTVTDKIITGIFLGLTGVVIMLTPWILVPGLVFDTRSVLLSVSGLFFGNIPTLIAMLITGIYRIILGGDGLWMGLAVIASSGTIGLLWRRFRPDWQKKRALLELLGLGITVHIVMLACIMLLPAEIRFSTLRTVALQVMVIYPIGNLLFGILMLNVFRHFQTKRELLLSEEKFRQLFEKTDVMMMLVEPESGKIVDANPASSAFYGYSIPELTRKTIQEINMLPKEKAYEVRQKVLREEQNYFEVSHKLASGEIRSVGIHTSPIKFQGKTVIFSIIHDISDRKKAETALIRAKEKAEESDRLKSTFLATISHELRTPLNAIIGFSKLISEGQENEDNLRFSHIIHKSGTHLLSIIESILDIALLQSKESKVTKSVFPVSELFLDLDNYLMIEKSKKGKQHLHSRFVPDRLVTAITLHTDRVKITQLLSNLLNNAIKYTENGTIEYGYSLTGRNITFFVKDTGIGIPPEKEEEIFNLFIQADDSHSRLHGGVGLGLAICKEIATLLGGKIWVDSVPGSGSSFFFSLDDATEEIKPVIKSETAADEIPSLASRTILIVDDTEDNTFLLKKILSKTGAKVLTAHSGTGAVAAVKKNKEIDMVLMDIKMPGMNGYEATREIHAINPSIPVVAQTAYAFIAEKEEAFEAGCIDHITKPIMKTQLYEILNRIFPANDKTPA